MSDSIKEAFAKVRQDIEYIYQELADIKYLLEDIKLQQPTQPTNQHITPTQETSIPTQYLPQYDPISGNNAFSTGNKGVPTNQQTNQQTNQHPPISTPTQPISSFNDKINNLHRVSELLGTLDDLKKEVRLKFKRLTEQEMLIYSSIYSLEDQGFMVDYSLLAQKTNLSEISIRDYIRKIIQKQIPLIKSKESNKKVLLSIPQDLKRIAPLNIILQLRSL